MYWNNYQLAYTGGFSSIENHVRPSVDYTIEIYKKYINGDPPIVAPIVFGKDPCIISYLDDDIINSIKGCEVTLNLLNIDNTLPLSTFYSDSDDEWKVLILADGVSEFEGFLIQDACQEIQTDIAHVITLRFTDGLGLLKNISFDQAFKLTANNLTSPRVRLCQISAIPDSYPFTNVYPSVNTDTACFLLFNASGLNIQKFDTLYVNILDTDINLTAYNGIYTVNEVVQLGANKFRVHVDEPITRLQDIAVDAEICCITHEDINVACPILHILKSCLHNTGLKLDTYLSSQLIVEDSAGESNEILENVLIEPNSYSNNGSYESCYDVLSSILDRFNLAVFQGFHRWNIFRFYEKRFVNSFDGYRYSYDYTQRFNVSNLEGYLTIGNQTDIEYGLLSTIIRPKSYVLDEYNFEQRDKLVINSDFLETDGPKGNFTYYPASPVLQRAWHSKYWRRPNGSRPQSAYILDTYIEEDNFKSYNRFVRYLNVDRLQALGDVDIYYLKSQPIDVNYGDKISISFSFSFDVYYEDGTLAMRFPVIITDGTNTFYLSNTLGPDDNKEGFTTDQNEIFLFTTKMTDRVFSVSMSATSISEGKLYIYLPRGIDQTLSTPAGLFFNPYIGYKDIEIKVEPFIIGNATAKNQYNKVSGNLSLKNDVRIESLVSDSPRNFLQGALFTKYFEATGVRTRTKNWKENSLSEFHTIQRVTSSQRMVYYYKNRQKLEGKYLAATDLYTDFVGTKERILNPAFFISLPTIYNGKEYIFGKMDINLKENNVDCTMYEIVSEDDPGENIDSVFNNLFTYTYNTK